MLRYLSDRIIFSLTNFIIPKIVAKGNSKNVLIRNFGEPPICYPEQHFSVNSMNCCLCGDNCWQLIEIVFINLHDALKLAYV